jgi:hypothetical protein
LVSWSAKDGDFWDILNGILDGDFGCVGNGNGKLLNKHVVGEMFL